MSGTPLRSVLTAFEDGALSRAEVEHLLRLGRLDARELAVGCPDGGCGTCASGHGDSPGCGASGPSARRSGPVLVSLSVRRPGAR
jgi:hypothetical protein